MAFKYEQNCARPLNDETLKLLESIDEFQHKVLNPHYKSLGEIHNEITVEVVDDIEPKEYTIETTLGELRKQLEDIKKYNAEAETFNEKRDKIKLYSDKKTTDETKVPEVSDELRGIFEWEPYKSPIDTKTIDDLLEKYEGKGDDYHISDKVTIEILGRYKREGYTGCVVLKYSEDEMSLASTYIHEMMHAFYDSYNLNENEDTEYTEYVEEPLAEYGMLHLLYEYFNEEKSIERAILLKQAYNNVEKKQLRLAIAHYGFGAYLFDYYMHIKWENLLFDKHPRNEDSIFYKNIKDLIGTHWQEDKELKSVADNMSYYLNEILPIETEAKYPIPHDKNWIFRFPANYHSKNGTISLKAGDRLIFSGNEPHIFTVNGVSIGCDFRFIHQLIDSNFNKNYKLIVTNTKINSTHCDNCIEVELSYIGAKPTQIEVNIDCAKAIHFIDGIEYHLGYSNGIHKTLEIVVDDNYNRYRYDKEHNVLIDNTNQRLVLGFDNSTIPNGVKIIGWAAFAEQQDLTSITIPDGVVEIEDYAFMNCPNLTTVTMPNSVTKIGEWAFSHCVNLTSITISNGVKKLEKFAFSTGLNITSITIPGTIEIHEYAFMHCKNIKTISITPGTTKIEYIFYYISKQVTSINIPESVEEIEDRTFYCCENLTTINVDKNNKHYYFDEERNALMDKRENKIVWQKEKE